jgi:parvulin-like peptidyl-prolyl isomerase
MLRRTLIIMQFIRKNIKPILLVMVVVFIVSIFYGLGQYRSSGSRSQQAGNIIAQVNGVGINYQQWHNVFMNFVSQYDSQTLSGISDELLASIKNSITEQLINSTLLYQYAEKEKIDIPASRINDEIEQIKSSFGSEQDFNNALRRNNLTLNQLKESLKNQYMVDQAIHNEYAQITISDEEIAQYYEEYESFFFQPEKRKISHILVEDKEEAELLLNQLNDGIIDFETTAKEKSICPSAEKNGDLGYISRGQMVPEFEEASFSLEAGNLSDIVKTEFGYHIIKCYDTQEEKQLSLEEAGDNIKSILTSQKQNERIDELIAQLREDADIVILYDFTSELQDKEEDKEISGDEITETEINQEENGVPETSVEDISENPVTEEMEEELAE